MIPAATDRARAVFEARQAFALYRAAHQVARAYDRMLMTRYKVAAGRARVAASRQALADLALRPVWLR